MRVEPFGFNHVLADDGETGLVSMFLRMRVRAARSRCRSREEPNGSVSENAIHVEENYFDFLCAIERVGHWLLVLSIWYLAESSRLSCCTRTPGFQAKLNTKY